MALGLGSILGLTLGGCAAAPVATARDVADANDVGATVQATSVVERAVLTAAGTLASGESQRIAGATVTAEPPYAAASGRTCRQLRMGLGRAEARLACSDGAAWFFVPDVFGGSPSSSGEPRP